DRKTSMEKVFEQRSEEHALRRSEIAAVGSSQQDPEPEQRASLVSSPLSRGQPSAEARLNGHEYAGDQDQGRYDRVERRLGELEEQQSSRNAAKGGQHSETHSAAHPATQHTP